MAKQSDLERAFETRWIQLNPGYPDPLPEYQFHPERKWKFDFAWPYFGVAVELEGGVFTGGRHTRGVGFTEDCAKYNAAAERGWLVLRYTGGMLESDPFQVYAQIQSILSQRKVSLNDNPNRPTFAIPQPTARKKRGSVGVANGRRKSTPARRADKSTPAKR